MHAACFDYKYMYREFHNQLSFNKNMILPSGVNVGERIQQCFRSKKMNLQLYHREPFDPQFFKNELRTVILQNLDRKISDTDIEYIYRSIPWGQTSVLKPFEVILVNILIKFFDPKKIFVSPNQWKNLIRIFLPRALFSYMTSNQRQKSKDTKFDYF